MKRLFFAVLALSIALAQLMAEDTEPPTRYRLSLSWSAGYEAQPEIFCRTSMMGFGFQLFDTEKVNIQNHMTYGTGIMNREDTGIKLYQHIITEKLTVGRMTRNGLFRPYGLVEGRFGFCGTTKLAIVENPPIRKFGIGTGFDVYPMDTLSFFLELGFIGSFYEGEFIPQQRFEIGMRVHLVPMKK